MIALVLISSLYANTHVGGYFRVQARPDFQEEVPDWGIGISMDVC